MSLINDALKRTQQTTAANEPPRLADLELRPIEPGQPPAPHDEGGGAKRAIWIVVLLVIACNIALWIVFKDRGSETEVAARTAEVEPVVPVAPEPTPVVVDSVVSEVPVEVVDTNATAVVEMPTEEPFVIERPAFLLKTIVTHPTRPSAMVNNRILFVGDRVEGYTVIAIGKDDVTLALDEDEVVVSLP